MRSPALILSCILTAIVLSSCSGDPKGGDQNEELDALDTILERGKIIVACDAAYPPFETVDESGAIVGFDVDMMRAIAGKLGVEAEFANTAWDGIIPALVTKKCDVICSGMSITDERKERVDFSDPYDHVQQVVMIRKDRAAKLPDAAALNSDSFTIAVQIGTTGEAAAKEHFPNAKRNTFETAPDAANEVLAGNSDAFVFDDPFIKMFMKKGEHAEKLELLGKAFTSEPIGIAIRKGETRLVERVNEILKELEADGTMAELRKKWRD